MTTESWEYGEMFAYKWFSYTKSILLISYIDLLFRESGIDPIREELHSQCFDEIIRQVTIDLPERGNCLIGFEFKIDLWE